MTRTSLVILAALALTQSAAAQVSPGPLTLAQAIALGRERGINAALARYNVQVADARAGQRRADLLPTVTLNGSIARKTINWVIDCEAPESADPKRKKTMPIR